jgi:hypothetical protein
MKVEIKRKIKAGQNQALRIISCIKLITDGNLYRMESTSKLRRQRKADFINLPNNGIRKMYEVT